MRDGQASQTARRVAAQRRHFDRVPVDYGDADADQQLHDDVAGDLPYDDTPFTAYLAARTRFFDTAVVDAVARGCPQIVAVGAGYDGRSLRYSAPAVRWFELDRPATLADKAARLVRLGLTTEAASQVAVDFSVDDAGHGLAAAGHDASLPSLFICEGVTPYLNRGVVIRLLGSLRACAVVGSQLAIDLALKPESEQAGDSRAALQAVVEALGEPFQFELPKAELEGLLRGAGWDVQRAVDPAGVAMASSTRPTVFVTATPAHAAARERVEVRLRPMTAAEFDALRSPLVSEYAADHVRAGNWSADEGPTRAAEALQQLLPQGVDTPGMLLLIASDAAGERIGHLWLALEQRGGSGSLGFIYDIQVDSAHRGKGYGRALLNAAEVEAARHGADAMGLNVFGLNHVARRLYESADYEVTTITMRKKLAGGESWPRW